VEEGLNPRSTVGCKKLSGVLSIKNLVVMVRIKGWNYLIWTAFQLHIHSLMLIGIFLKRLQLLTLIQFLLKKTVAWVLTALYPEKIMSGPWREEAEMYRKEHRSFADPSLFLISWCLSRIARMSGSTSPPWTWMDQNDLYAIPEKAVNLIETCDVIHGRMGTTLRVEYYWKEILRHTNFDRGERPISAEETVTVGTSSSESVTESFVNSWERATETSFGGTAGFTWNGLGASLNSSISRSQKNAGSRESSKSSFEEFYESKQIKHTFEFNGLGPEDPSPVDLCWWQLVERCSIGSVFFVHNERLDPRTSKPDELIFWQNKPLNNSFHEVTNYREVYTIAKTHDAPDNLRPL
jgi:hypothetical protein